MNGSINDTLLAWIDPTSTTRSNGSFSNVSSLLISSSTSTAASSVILPTSTSTSTSSIILDSLNIIPHPNMAATLSNNLSPTLAMTSSVGAIVIESLTILASLYLLKPLTQQGLSKLRVRLLIGMVVSDLALGLVGAVPNAAWLAGRSLRQGTPSCNAAGFLLTGVLFTQHLWTLVIAIATFALLKHPMSRFTFILDRYWIWIPVSIWTVSLVHSGVWWRYIGFTPSTSGALCYYGTGSYQYDRDLVQFIPRALVFVIVIVLYSQLFRFLRRPDTIQVSSTEASSFDFGTLSQSVPDGTDLGLGGGTRSGSGMTTKGILLRAIRTRTSGRGGSGAGQGQQGQQGEGEDIPPWEKLHINNVGGWLDKDLEDDLKREKVGGREWGRTGTGLGMGEGEVVVVLNGGERGGTLGTTLTGSSGTTERSETSGTTATSSLAKPLPLIESLPVNGTVRRVSIDPGTILLDERKLASLGGDVSPPIPILEKEKDKSSLLPLNSNANANPQTLDDEEVDLDPEQTLEEFFSASQAASSHRPFGSASFPGGLNHGDQRGETESLGPHRSASSYFNRQASLLMLYFPIAYLIVFTFSLVRLLYDMITVKPNQVLTMLSLWFVLSVGLVDALVYGLAEYVVRRRVRRRMPDRFQPRESDMK